MIEQALVQRDTHFTQEAPSVGHRGFRHAVLNQCLRPVLAAISLSLIAGCASTKQFIPIAQSQGTAPSDPRLARIYLMRTKSMVGAGTGYPIQEGRNTVGSVGSGGHLLWERPPGEVRIVDPDRMRKVEPLRFTVEAGRTYYVRLNVGANTFTLLDEAEGLKTLKECSTKPKPAKP